MGNGLEKDGKFVGIKRIERKVQKEEIRKVFGSPQKGQRELESVVLVREEIGSDTTSFEDVQAEVAFESEPIIEQQKQQSQANSPYVSPLYDKYKSKYFSPVRYQDHSSLNTPHNTFRQRQHYFKLKCHPTTTSSKH